jgi:hypothetical protein
MSDVALKDLALCSCDYDDASPEIAMRFEVGRSLFPPRA